MIPIKYVLALLVVIEVIAAPITAHAFVAPICGHVANIALAPISSHAIDIALATMAAVPAMQVEQLGIGGYSVVEFARLFKISRGMVYKLQREGRLRFTKIGNRTIITIVEARRFQAALETDAE